MKILVIATHPNIKESKVNKIWIEALKKENNITIRFLDEIYKENKMIDIEQEKKFLEKAERVVFQFPFYWYNMPALMREYFDKVFEYGWAYGPNGDALKEKEFLVALSIGAPEYSYMGGSYNNFTITELLRPLEATANALQMVYLPYFALFNTPRLSDDEVESSANRYIKHINNIDINHRKYLERLKKENKESSFIDL
ncbi:NAD(P)H-dependent oxidoreductase [Cetobacterium somerae]|uniref:NAD(P)H-dependent oxidoreductase n=1 Tax=Cetobacterium sp. NK01 TaxID=2993530 RepID=UPI0021160D54|nr:NAD(P)H-dependent oxidoreductase [Cetobacterium sp. NK01]MCQ8213141.1 NAD(P)H-dependent oxidoreductase [Cetobacterium sp. NK01]